MREGFEPQKDARSAAAKAPEDADTAALERRAADAPGPTVTIGPKGEAGTVTTVGQASAFICRAQTLPVILVCIAHAIWSGIGDDADVGSVGH